jgi:hypothetical protein
MGEEKHAELDEEELLGSDSGEDCSVLVLRKKLGRSHAAAAIYLQPPPSDSKEDSGTAAILYHSYSCC